MHINTYRQLLTEQGWDVVSTNTGHGRRYYHAEHLELKRSFAGFTDHFKNQAREHLHLGA